MMILEPILAIWEISDDSFRKCAISMSDVSDASDVYDDPYVHSDARHIKDLYWLVVVPRLVSGNSNVYFSFLSSTF